MSTQWLAVQSFERSQDILGAINTVSIHLTLRLAGVPDEERMQAVARARDTLTTFFKKLDATVQEAQRGEATPLLGVDPRLRQLVKSFVSAKRDRRRFHSVLFQRMPGDMVSLFASEKDEDLEALVQCLAEFRVILEEHVYEDTARILGEI